MAETINKWICVIDTETTGLPEMYKDFKMKKYYPPRQTEKYDKSRIVQVTALFFNTHTQEKVILDEIIKPTYDFIIDNDEFHGITQQRAEEEGIYPKQFFEKLKKKFNEMNTVLIVGHNIWFDVFILQSEMYRIYETMALRNIFYKIPKFCTMVKSKHLNGNKNPKLDLLYSKLFNEERIEEHKHNSLYDTEDTLRCYLKLVNP